MLSEAKHLLCEYRQCRPFASLRVTVFIACVHAAWLFLTGCTAATPGALATPYPTLSRPLPTLTPGPLHLAEFAPIERPSASRGMERYTALCESCHGETGRGDTALARTLSPRPANFHDLEFLRRRTPSSLYHSISKGVLGTGMLAYEGQLSEAQRWDVLAYLWTFHRQSDELAAGQSLYAQHCAACHGANGAGGLASPLANPSLLAGRTGYGMFNALSGGLPATPNHEWSTMSEADRWAIVEYVWTFMFGKE
ncbi:MAG: c-type cytochrome [Anaerolineae bacterium]|nr:c-type cytochrome [Anaerolineae bacterium]